MFGLHKETCRGLVVLVIDSLRADFQRVCASEGIPPLASFQRLQAITSPLPYAKCGSVGSLPMRTDLLTGKLAFLDRRWAAPLDTDRLWTRELARSGVRTTLVTDNYILLLREIRGCLDDFFGRCVFVRGAGSDSWRASDEIQLPTGEAGPSILEARCVANVNAWQSAGGPPYDRLFQSAERTLLAELNSGDRFLLWIDSFSPHEPWIEPLDLRNCSPLGIPILPRSGLASRYDSVEIRELRHRYAKRIEALDGAMASFCELLMSTLRGGDVALLVISDHGFLFGEYGFIGKPKEWPPVPELYDIVAWASPHFSFVGRPPISIQPHRLCAELAGVLGSTTRDFRREADPVSEWQLIGRNGPKVRHLVLTDTREQGVIWRDDVYEPVRWYKRAALDRTSAWPDVPYRGQSGPWLGLQKLRTTYNGPWLTHFQKSFAELNGFHDKGSIVSA